MMKIYKLKHKKLKNIISIAADSIPEAIKKFNAFYSENQNINEVDIESIYLDNTRVIDIV